MPFSPAMNSATTAPTGPGRSARSRPPSKEGSEAGRAIPDPDPPPRRTVGAGHVLVSPGRAPGCAHALGDAEDNRQDGLNDDDDQAGQAVCSRTRRSAAGRARPAASRRSCRHTAAAAGRRPCIRAHDQADDGSDDDRDDQPFEDGEQRRARVPTEKLIDRRTRPGPGPGSREAGRCRRARAWPRRPATRTKMPSPAAARARNTWARSRRAVSVSAPLASPGPRPARRRPGARPRG